MAMATNEPTLKWRNVAAWSVMGAVFYILVVWGVSSLVHEDGLGALLRSKKAVAISSLGWILAAASVGFSNRKRPFKPRAFRNFLIRDGVAVVAILLIVWGFSALAGAGALDSMSVSEWFAAVAGSAVVFFAFLGILAVWSAHAGTDLIDDELAADNLRERSRLILYSFVWMVACGLLLILLGLAGPGGVLPPAAALAGALLLIGILVALGIAVWRLSDELDHTLSHEAGSMAFYLILVLGGGWAMLAHLDYVAAPAPIDWLTLSIVLMFVASFIAVGRRKLLAP